jgi:hypothetical protein
MYIVELNTIEGTELLLGGQYIVRAISGSQGVTVITDDGSPDPVVSESIDDLVAASGGKIVKVTIDGVENGIAKAFVNRIVPNDDGSTSIVMDDEQKLVSSDLYTVLEPLFADCGGSAGPIHGNILYVSKNGDNDTAQKGNPDKPWREPWTARAAAVSGDTIYLLPGEYTTNNISDGSDFISGSGGDLNLGGVGIKYYMSEGSQITYRQNSSIAVFRYRTPGTVYDTEVFGRGIFRTEGLVRFIDNRNELTNRLHIECKEIQVGSSNASAWGNAEFTQQLFIRTDRWVFDPGASCTWWELPVVDNSFQYIEIGEAICPNQFNVTNWGNDSDDATNKFIVHKYGRFLLDSRTNYMYDIRSANHTDTYMYLKIQELINTNSSGPYDEYYRVANGTGVWNNTRMHIVCDFATLPTAFWRNLGGSVSPNGVDDGVYVKGTFYFPSITGANVDSGWDISNNLHRFHFDCDMISEGDPIIDLQDSIPRTLIIRGTYSRNSDGTVISMAPGAGISFFNAAVLNTGSAATIESATPITINAAGLGTSNTTQDVDITWANYHEIT